MVHGIHGYPVAAAVVCGTLGVALWCYKHHFQRFTAWCFGAAGFFLAIGIPAWTDSLAGLALTGGGLLALTVVTMVSGLIFYLEAFRSAGKPGKLGVFLRWLHMLPARRGPVLGRNRHHRIRTHLGTFVFGTVLAIDLGASRLMIAGAGQTVAGAGVALAQTSQQVNNGTAAKHLDASDRRKDLLTGGAIIGGIAVGGHGVGEPQEGRRQEGQHAQGCRGRQAPRRHPGTASGRGHAAVRRGAVAMILLGFAGAVAGAYLVLRSRLLGSAVG